MKFITFASLLATGALASVCHHDSYECCTGCKPLCSDDDGKWGAENGQWCLIDAEKCADYHDPNYKECEGCEIIATDIEGNWGAENGEWCFINDSKCLRNISESVEQQQNEQPAEQQSTEQPAEQQQNEQSAEQQQNEQPAEQQQGEQQQEEEQHFFQGPQSNKPHELPTDLTPSGVLPVIAITTVSGTNDSVTQPVSKMVSDLFSLFIPNYVVPPEPYFEECTITVTDAEGKSLLEKVKGSVKVRGNFTTNYSKKPLRIKFDEKQSILGMNHDGKFKNWVLLAGYKDSSMVRDVTTLSIARELYASEGYYVSDTRYIELTVNGEYMGMYILAEQQQIAKGRIDIPEAKKDYEGIDIGYLLEFDGYAQNEEPFNKAFLNFHNQDVLKGLSDGSETGLPSEAAPEGGNDKERLTVKNDLYSQAQHDFIDKFVNGAYDIMYEAAYNNKSFVFNEDYTELVESQELSGQQAVEKVVDVNSLALYYIINEIACDADVAFSSFYMSVDFSAEGSKKLTFQAPWDFDSALGFKKGRCTDGQGLFAASVVPRADDNPGNQINAWLAVLIHQPWFQEIIRSKWNENYQKGTFTSVISNIQKDTNNYTKAFENNYKRWDNDDHFGAIAYESEPVINDFNSQAENANYVAEWLQKRIEFINNYWSKN